MAGAFLRFLKEKPPNQHPNWYDDLAAAAEILMSEAVEEFKSRMGVLSVDDVLAELRERHP